MNLILEFHTKKIRWSATTSYFYTKEVDFEINLSSSNTIWIHCKLTHPLKTLKRLLSQLTHYTSLEASTVMDTEFVLKILS